MAIGGSPTSRRITAWHHTCCNTVRWSAQRTCDLCGTQADYYRPGVPIGVLMERLHSEDKPGSVVTQSQAAAPAPAVAPAAAASASSAPAERAAAPPATTPASGNPAAAVTRPPGARPHRPHAEDDAPVPHAPTSAVPERWSALHRMGLAGAIALIASIGAALSVDRGETSLKLLMVAMAALLVVVLSPVVAPDGPGEAAR